MNHQIQLQELESSIDSICDIPVIISDEELIVRAILSPFHTSNNKKALVKGAFKPRPGSSDVSVVRHSYLDATFCKKNAKRIAEESRDPNAKYQGLAVIKASQIRNIGSKVKDSRQEYCGHADLCHGIILVKGEPVLSAEQLELDNKLKALKNIAKYYPDPRPENDEWDAEQLLPNL